MRRLSLVNIAANVVEAYPFLIQLAVIFVDFSVFLKTVTFSFFGNGY